MKSDYNTRQKNVMLEYLKACGGHITAAELIKGLCDRGERVSPATVYRRLEKMVDEGLIRKYITDKEACFQYVGESCDGHFHLKCVCCGTHIHIDCKYLSGLGEHILKEHGFCVDNRRTVMYGICKSCNGKESGELD